MFEAGLITALSVLFVYWWIGFKRIVRFGLFIDIITFASLTWMFHGTYIGMMTGAFAALLVSVTLRGLAYYYRMQRLKELA